MTKTIVIESMYLYDHDRPERGITVGGSQRYSIDLGRLFHKLGYDVIFLTKAKIFMEAPFEDWATIIALESPRGGKGIFQFSRRVYSFCKDREPDLACYSDLQVGFPYCYENSFALQHGIAWDNPHNWFKHLLKAHYYLKAMHKFKCVICVDTNFVNWCRERDKAYFDNPGSLVYIPNYADEHQFAYSYKEWNGNEELKLLYPRRLVRHRGFELFMAMCERLHSKGYNIKPVLAFEEFRENDFMRAYPQYNDLQCSIVHPGMDEIHKYYKEAFLTFIPTLWSEGTSLSAIESISTGCPVIASDVGGLGNIVLPGLNGYIVPPTVDNFVSITEKILSNVSTRNELAANCKNMNRIFGKKRWESQVYDTIKPLL